MTGWPVDIEGVVESIVTTLGPNGQWNVAALGLHGTASEAGAVRARTWGRTRTWRNFREQGGGYVQFTQDPVDFVEAALAVREEADPVLDSADAWVEITVDAIESGTDDGTLWVDWELTAQHSHIETETVPLTTRGFYAVVEATVAASRLDVDSYDTEELKKRLAYFQQVVERCGSGRDERAFDLLCELSDWER